MAAAGDVVGGTSNSPLFINKFGVKVNGVDVNNSTAYSQLQI